MRVYANEDQSDFIKVANDDSYFEEARELYLYNEGFHIYQKPGKDTNSEYCLNEDDVRSLEIAINALSLFDRNKLVKIVDGDAEDISYVLDEYQYYLCIGNTNEKDDFQKNCIKVQANKTNLKDRKIHLSWDELKDIFRFLNVNLESEIWVSWIFERDKIGETLEETLVWKFEPKPDRIPMQYEEFVDSGAIKSDFFGNTWTERVYNLIYCKKMVIIGFISDVRESEWEDSRYVATYLEDDPELDEYIKEQYGMKVLIYYLDDEFY